MLSTVKLMTVDELGFKSERNGFLITILLVSVSHKADGAKPIGFVKWQFDVLASLTVNVNGRLTVSTEEIGIE